MSSDTLGLQEAPSLHKTRPERGTSGPFISEINPSTELSFLTLTAPCSCSGACTPWPTVRIPSSSAPGLLLSRRRFVFESLQGKQGRSSNIVNGNPSTPRPASSAIALSSHPPCLAQTLPITLRRRARFPSTSASSMISKMSSAKAPMVSSGACFPYPAPLSVG